MFSMHDYLVEIGEEVGFGIWTEAEQNPWVVFFFFFF